MENENVLVVKRESLDSFYESINECFGLRQQQQTFSSNHATPFRVGNSDAYIPINKFPIGTVIIFELDERTNFTALTVTTKTKYVIETYDSFSSRMILKESKLKE